MNLIYLILQKYIIIRFIYNKRIPRDIRDIENPKEIEEINNEILRIYSKKKFFDFLYFKKIILFISIKSLLKMIEFLKKDN